MNKIKDYKCAIADMQCLYGQVLLKHYDKDFDFLFDELCNLTNALTQDRQKAFNDFCVAKGKIVPGHPTHCGLCAQP